MQYLGDFQPEKILVSLNVKDDDDGPEIKSYETVEYGGFLLMMDTVPEKSDYDYGESYLRTSSRRSSRGSSGRQAVLRPRQVGRRLDGRIGDGARRTTSPGRRSGSWVRPS